MKHLQRFAIISTLATYFLIFVGGLVRVSGAGLGCPDWPKCFGRWIPPTNISQLPADMDPSMFNFTLAWIEYTNRLVGMTVGLLILTTAILALVHARNILKIWLPSVIAALLVAYQGWQGGQVVATELEPIVVSAHMGIALIIVTLLVYIAQQSYYVRHPKVEAKAEYPAKIKGWLIAVWITSIVQIVLGTQLRSTIEILSEGRPFAVDSSWVANLGIVNHTHQAIGVLLIGLGLHVGIKILLRSKNSTSLVFQSAIALVALMGLQAISAASLIMFGMPSIMRLVHLWIASGIIGVLLLLFSAVNQQRKFAK
ncbi:COX15/CtaA family protein [bacterium]|nr:COX15/CtaA family protein [bacterium]